MGRILELRKKQDGRSLKAASVGSRSACDHMMITLWSSPHDGDVWHEILQKAAEK